MVNGSNFGSGIDIGAIFIIIELGWVEAYLKRSITRKYYLDKVSEIIFPTHTQNGLMT